MTAYIIEYGYHGAPGNGVGCDELPQIPGASILSMKEYDTSSAKSHSFNSKTSFFMMVSDTAVNFDYEAAETGVSTAGNRGYWPANAPYYQGIKDKNGAQIITHMSLVDA